MTPTTRRTRLKFCGLTRPEDVDRAVALGVDALGFVLYPPSPRYIRPESLGLLLARVPPFVTTVGLFVNASRAAIDAVLAQAPLDVLQLHGDESPEACAGLPRPVLKALRVTPGLDLLESVRRFATVQGFLLDAHVAGYGGGGKTFDWSLIPEELAPRVVLSGGLSAQNVAEALHRVRPYAVDVSSGIEDAPGVKNVERMRAFVDAVRSVDATSFSKAEP